ncbi:hypothetical protein QNI19_14635 [Cytophagaceae bacterium DM2B3-1]|uniref:Uncharacterized protein n=1 Tax=Xanthocytophaga flava TaxID=3048013 RepID=A0ABT7CKB3_9BACT|nr:hypothetical protein [Xanthocytophaga flavus]MDJ1494177.1 hypothetical protein [Xanthocytophaga flavus]
MRKFVIVSRKFDCEIIFSYSNGVFMGFEVNKELPAESLQFIVNTAFYKLSDLQKAYSSPKLKGALVELVQLISFDEFWNKYDYALDKKRAKDVWDKLPVHEQTRAYDYIENYNNELRKSGTAKMYAKTYLKNKVWDV